MKLKLIKNKKSKVPIFETPLSKNSLRKNFFFFFRKEKKLLKLFFF